jgi:hypothetical protein
MFFQTRLRSRGVARSNDYELDLIPDDSETGFQNKIDFALGHLDQIFPINTTFIARFNDGVQSSDGARREGDYSLRRVSDYFVRSQHPAIHRHAAMNDDRAPMIFDNLGHGVLPAAHHCCGGLSSK